MTAFTAGSGGTTGAKGGCSYVAPVRKFQLTGGLVSEYQFHLTIGTLDKIRTRFGTLRKAE